MPVIKKALLFLAKLLLTQIVKQVAKVIVDMAQDGLNPLRRMVEAEVEPVWRGKGATAFVDELSSIFIPEFERVSTTLTKLNGDIQFACDRLEQADVGAAQLVRGRLDEKARFF